MAVMFKSQYPQSTTKKVLEGRTEGALEWMMTVGGFFAWTLYSLHF